MKAWHITHNIILILRTLYIYYCYIYLRNLLIKRLIHRVNVIFIDIIIYYNIYILLLYIMALSFSFVALEIARDFVEVLKIILFKYLIRLEKNDEVSSVDEVKDWFEAYVFS